MFTKYTNQFQKAEAEWVLEVLDMHSGDYEKAVQSIRDSLQRLTKRAPDIGDLKSFDEAIAVCFFASRDWWAIGMERLAKLGRVTMPTRV